MRAAAASAAASLLLLVAAGGAFQHLAYRALPQTEGELRLDGPQAAIEIVRDRWGVPHIRAESDEDAYFGLGFVHAQDRLFQMELSRHLAQGRLAEVVGPRALKLDRLFRTLDLHGAGVRLQRRSSPRARAALAAYARGANAWATRLGGRLPLEFALLGRGFAPVEEHDFLGVMGYMAWGLNLSWHFDPLYEKLVARVGPERAAELFPYNRGGSPAVHPPASAALAGALRTALFELGPDERRLLELVPAPLRGSNNWVVAPRHSASGQALLANDPHLSHGLPGIWYEAQLTTPTQDVIGVTIPGLPLVVIGHNRDIAWGFTNVMLDGADFFVEQLDPADPTRVLHRGAWVPVGERHETLRVRGGRDERLIVRSTPHGPLVSGLLGDAGLALSYRWTYLAAEQADELEGFLSLDRARDWDEFRAALRHFGAVAQNVAYADRRGHIGMQTCGLIPRLTGALEGTRLREGALGTQEWDGYWPFEDNPKSFDPPEGLLSSANNPTVEAPGRYYISSQWEPPDRITRIRELLAAKDKLSLEDLAGIQHDFALVSARELVPLLQDALDARPTSDALQARARDELRGFDFRMDQGAVAPTLFAAFYRRLFYELLEDELGPEIAKGYREHANLSAIMMRAVIDGRLERWFDRQDTPQVEDRAEIFRRAFGEAVRELARALGPDVASWRWGRLHTLELQHPLGRASRLLAAYFNLGPFPVSGHTSTVAKMEFGEADFRVLHGPSMRQLTDFSNLDAARSVLPAGQSGLPASPHYSDQLPLWLAGRHHPLPMSAGAVDALAESRLRLVP